MMTNTGKKHEEACPCSQGIDRRKFLKAAAVAGMLAGCGKTLEAPSPTREPAATETPGPTRDPRRTEVPDLAGKKALYVLARDTYAVRCHTESAEVLAECGVEIVLAALEKKEIAVWGGGTPALTPDLTLDEVRVGDFDAVIFECGQPLESDNPTYQDFARETAEQGKVLGAVCMMPVILAKAGLLKGRQATSNATDLPTLQQFGAVVSFYEDPVRDGNIVTASFSGVEKFGWRVVEALSE
jgi:protease I